MAPRNNANMNTRLQNVEELVTTMGNIMRQQMQNPNLPNQPNVLEIIAPYQPPTYEGQEDPTVLEDWIRAFDKLFDTIQFTEEQKITAATYYLSGVADVWWQQHQGVREELPYYKWEKFKEDLRKRFYPASTKQAKYEEFIRLCQGTMSVQEYYSKFMELERFAPIYAQNEAERARKFEMGLNPHIRYALGGKSFSELQKVYDRAMTLSRLTPVQKERTPPIQNTEGRRSEKRQKYDKGKNQKGHNLDNPPPQDRQPMPRAPHANQPQCPKCNRRHLSRECSTECYYCGRPGHIARRCYTRKRDEAEKRHDNYNEHLTQTPDQNQGRGGRLNVINQTEAGRCSEVITKDLDHGSAGKGVFKFLGENANKLLELDLR